MYIVNFLQICHEKLTILVMNVSLMFLKTKIKSWSIFGCKNVLLFWVLNLEIYQKAIGQPPELLGTQWKRDSHAFALSTGYKSQSSLNARNCVIVLQHVPQE